MEAIPPLKKCPKKVQYIDKLTGTGKEELHDVMKLKERKNQEVRDTQVMHSRVHFKFYHQVPRISNPTKEQFLNEIYTARKPVIFTNVDMGQCSALWNPEYLVEVVYLFSRSNRLEIWRKGNICACLQVTKNGLHK